MNNRDFKGVWIDKKIWLDKDLTAIEKCLLAEIDSLDNEGHCYAKNEYFAEFLGVSIPTVSRAVKKLIAGGYIEILIFTGRSRILKSLIRQPNQNDQAASSKRSGSQIKMISPSTNTSTSTTTNTYTEDFLSFWKSYPRNTNKRQAFKCWMTRLKEGITAEHMTACATNYAAQLIVDKTEVQFYMHAATFLGVNKRYEDYETAVKAGGKPEGRYTDKNDVVWENGKKIGHYDGGRFIPA